MSVTLTNADKQGPEIFGVWVASIILGALGVVLITLATRAIIRARRAEREADKACCVLLGDKLRQ
jgi:hypothetical protein